MTEPYKFEKISSITSLYKSKKFLRNFTEQFYNQTIFQDVEIIIIDCNEDEEDYDSIRKFCREPNVFYEKLDTDPGLYGAWNKALSYVNTPYVTNSNTDDVKAPWYFETMLHYMDQHPECDVAYGPVGKSSNPATPFYKDFPAELWQCLETNLSTMLVDNSPHCMPTWRMQLHKELGNFDENYSVKADFEFWLRCLKNNKKFNKLNMTMGNYYFNPNGASVDEAVHKKRNNQHSRIIEKYYKDEPPSTFNFYKSIIKQSVQQPSYGKMIIKNSL